VSRGLPRSITVCGSCREPRISWTQPLDGAPGPTWGCIQVAVSILAAWDRADAINLRALTEGVQREAVEFGLAAIAMALLRAHGAQADAILRDIGAAAAIETAGWDGTWPPIRDQ